MQLLGQRRSVTGGRPGITVVSPGGRLADNALMALAGQSVMRSGGVCPFEKGGHALGVERPACGRRCRFGS
jgi:hypothetical protein